MVRSLCVYCGSSLGSDARHRAAAAELGERLARAGVDMVYGGGSVGLMGVAADAALEAGGRVIGVLPRGLFRREVAHQHLTELIEVGSMHERKQVMFDRADAFAALPGGLGTLEELAEVATWAQLGIHAKPVAVVDVGGYWGPLLDQLDRAVAHGFLGPATRSAIVRVERVADLLAALVAAPAPARPDGLTAGDI